HIDPVARGGKASVERIRLRCRGHNQYEAEQVFGATFMKKKREEARRVRGNKPHGLEVREPRAIYRIRIMAKPALKGTAKLSSGGSGMTSKSVAAPAPASATSHGRLVTFQANRKDTRRHAIEPSSVFLEPKRWMRPHALPTSAAAVSPRMSAPRAATQMSF